MRPGVRWVDPSSSMFVRRLMPNCTRQQLTVATEATYPPRASSRWVARADHLRPRRHPSINTTRSGWGWVGLPCGSEARSGIRPRRARRARRTGPATSTGTVRRLRLRTDVRDGAVLAAAHQAQHAGRGQRGASDGSSREVSLTAGQWVAHASCRGGLPLPHSPTDVTSRTT